MRREFLSEEDQETMISVAEAQERCPWAKYFRRTEYGLWCFEALADARKWDRQSDDRRMIWNSTPIAD